MRVADDRARPVGAVVNEPAPVTADGGRSGEASDPAWFALDQVTHWIRFADTKASVLLATSGVIGGILLSRPAAAGGDLASVRAGLWGVALAAVALSALSALSALVPRLRSNRTGTPSLLYFGDVAQRFRRRPTEFVATFRLAMADPERIRREVVEQIWTNSLVARRKFRHVSAATWLIGLALISGGVAVYLERL
jgi:hypothetical protein